MNGHSRRRHGQTASGDVGVDTEPLLLEFAEALKWPHFGHTHSESMQKMSGS
jgi:hypothetical protein